MALSLRGRFVLLVGLAALLPLLVLPVLSPAEAGVLLLLLALLGVVAWRTAGDMARAIREVAAAARRLAAGDLRSPVSGGASQEIVALAAELERVRHHLIERQGLLENLQAAAASRERERGGEEAAATADLARRAADLAVFHAVTSTLSQSPDRGPNYEPALSQLLAHLEMDAAALYVVADHRELRLLAHVGHNPPALEAMARFPLGEGIAGRVARGGDTLVVEDASAGARLVRDVLRLEGFHGLAAVPLRGRGQILGVLEVVARARRKLGEHELMWLQAVAQHIGLVLANAALREEGERRAGRLRRLAQLAQPMTGSPSPQDVLALALAAAVQLLELVYARAWLWDPATGRPQPGPWRGRAELADEGTGADAAGRSPEAQVVALAAQGGEPIFIPDVASDARCPEPHWWARRGAVSLGAIPLRVGERTLGVLTVVPREASAFPEEDQGLLGLLASQAAVAFENARLSQEGSGAIATATVRAPTGVEAEREQIAAPAVQRPDPTWAAGALAALDAAVAAAEDAESALEVIADEVRHIVDAEVGAIFRLDAPRPSGTGRLLRLAAGGLQVGTGARLDGGSGVVGAALAAGYPRAALAPFAEPAEETLETFALSSGYRAVAVTPILLGDAPTGALAVCRRGPEPFESPALAALAAVAARVAAVWLDRARTADLKETS